MHKEDYSFMVCKINLTYNLHRFMSHDNNIVFLIPVGARYLSLCFIYDE